MKYRCPKCGKVSDTNWQEGVKVYHDCSMQDSRLSFGFKPSPLVTECVPMEGELLGSKPAASDTAVVARFNELVREGKISGSDRYREFSIDNGVWYCLRPTPTPQYRPFTAVEAVAHLGRKVKHNNSESESDWCLGENYVWIEKALCISIEDAFDLCIFADTGEPFGVKVE